MGAQDIAFYRPFYLLIFVVIIFVINHKMGIRLNRRIAYALFRMSIQLILVGFFLQYIFLFDRFWISTTYVLFMIMVAAMTTAKSCQLNLKTQLLPILLGFGLPNILMLVFINQFVIGLDKIFEAQYYIPLIGMLLGNSLSGNIIGINTFYQGLKKNEGDYYYRLSLSANQWEATLPWYKEAVVGSLNPIIASTETVGLVSLPGMMTGQILGGAMPMTAIVYQIVITAAILIVRYFSIYFTLLLTRKNKFDDYDRLKG